MFMTFAVVVLFPAFLMPGPMTVYKCCDCGHLYARLLTYSLLDWGWQMFSVKGQIVSVFGFTV